MYVSDGRNEEHTHAVSNIVVGQAGGTPPSLFPVPYIRVSLRYDSALSSQVDEYIKYAAVDDGDASMEPFSSSQHLSLSNSIRSANASREWCKVDRALYTYSTLAIVEL